MSRVMMYSRFERFWHWSQALLIICLIVTGFEIHGTWSLFGFEQAVSLHTILAWALVTLWVFAIFWHFTTGEWKQYLPDSREKAMKLLRHYSGGIFRREEHPDGPNAVTIWRMVRYYSYGIFRGEPHPFHMTPSNKHNPLQRIAYISLHIFITPFIWITGWAYLFYGAWSSWGLGGLSLTWVALLHTTAAFLMLAFLVAHLYLAITTSEKPFAYVKGMITGYESE